jgi:peptide/nickel transport system substrate-binding protein
MSGWVDNENYPMSGDPDKAKELLAESGLDLPIETTMRTRNDAPGYLEVTQAVQSQLKDVGINVNIESAVDSVNTGIIQTRASQVPAGINSWSQDYPDPDNFIDVLLDGTRITETNNQNTANFNNPEINEEIASLAGVTGEARDTAYHALDAKIISEYAPWAPILNPIRVDVISERVTAYPVHPIYGPDLAAIEIEE